jgi:hypothetical protein
MFYCEQSSGGDRAGKTKGRRPAEMTIEIHRPELETLIRERMRRGAFHDIEDALMQALQSSPFPAEDAAALPDETRTRSGSDLVEAMQASPHKEIRLELQRARLPVRDVVF